MITDIISMELLPFALFCFIPPQASVNTFPRADRITAVHKDSYAPSSAKSGHSAIPPNRDISVAFVVQTV